MCTVVTAKIERIVHSRMRCQDSFGLLSQVLRLLPWVWLVLLGGIATADQNIRLRVSAIVPPRPCQYPDRCEPVAPGTSTKVSVENGIIRYVGPVPSVIKTDGMITVLF